MEVTWWKWKLYDKNEEGRWENKDKDKDPWKITYKPAASQNKHSEPIGSTFPPGGKRPPFIFSSVKLFF